MPLDSVCLLQLQKGQIQCFDMIKHERDVRDLANIPPRDVTVECTSIVLLVEQYRLLLGQGCMGTRRSSS